MSTTNFGVIPEPMIWNIHTYLSPWESAGHERVCRHWRFALGKEIFWKNVCTTLHCIAVKGFSYKRQALLLKAEATLNNTITYIQTRRCKEEPGGYWGPVVSIEIDHVCKEMRMSWEKRYSLKADSPFLYSWIPLKYFFREDGSYKTQGDQILLKYENCDLLLTLCHRDSGSKSFAQSLHYKVATGINCGAVRKQFIEDAKLQIKNLNTTLMIN